MSTTAFTNDKQRYICVHGHFYQPPRENPWLEAIDSQDSAAPYHDWNARITHECYAANGSSRILNDEKKIMRIVNNYSRMSFNFGPTLLGWMEKSAQLSYRRVLDADRASQDRFGGHGSALAQVYNHIIMPLAETRDRITQIRWGIADFEYRFHRRPEGMWLAETAVDLETLDLLAQHGILFTILAPHQCARIREIPLESDDELIPWLETPHATVDPTQPYLVRTHDDRSIAVFFYDGPISRAVAFEGLLNDGRDFANRLLGGFRHDDDRAQLVHIATDGESYGHHHKHGDMALAYALDWIERNSGARLVNYGQFLEQFPPSYEAEIYESTSWSCSHGIERWRADCGCGTGGAAGWNQRWRAPLRSSLDWLRDAVRPLWDQAAATLLRDPVAARDAYIRVILDRTPALQLMFFNDHAANPPDAKSRTRILRLMEMERHLQLMVTSCGWFFDDLEGIETVQIIAYAGRVLQLARELFGSGGEELESQFLTRLSEARGNRAGQPNGADIYRQTMATQKIGIEQVGAHYAVVSLFEDQPEKKADYCYDVWRNSGYVLPTSRGRFAHGQASICSRITLECEDLDFAALHLGDQNLLAAVRRAEPRQANTFEQFTEEVRAAVAQEDFRKATRLFRREFGAAGDSLRPMSRDDQKRILKLLLDSTLAGIETSLSTIYEDHRSLLHYLSVTGMPKPQALMLAAQFSLNADLRHALSSEPFEATRVRQLLSQAMADQVALDAASLGYVASQRMLRAMQELQQRPESRELEAALEVMDVLRELPFEVDLWETQNRWYRISQESLPLRTMDPRWNRLFRELGTKLDIEVDQLRVDN